MLLLLILIGCVSCKHAEVASDDRDASADSGLEDSGSQRIDAASADSGGEPGEDGDDGDGVDRPMELGVNSGTACRKARAGLGIREPGTGFAAEERSHCRRRFSTGGALIS